MTHLIRNCTAVRPLPRSRRIPDVGVAAGSFSPTRRDRRVTGGERRVDGHMSRCSTASAVRGTSVVFGAFPTPPRVHRCTVRTTAIASGRA
ncbi:hypothetical protein ACFPM0_24245 [Pseudonocardia sulfidoxydans]|uniref:hypothetical protein n=1 Tax=Pseudonocardia sulfidoxydans TaxID=54011 RepID=UPI00361E214C